MECTDPMVILCATAVCKFLISCIICYMWSNVLYASVRPYIMLPMFDYVICNQAMVFEEKNLLNFTEVVNE